MLRLTWIEFFLRTMPETLIMIWGIHIISKKSINIPSYIVSSILISIIVFFIRYLPIFFGVHMILNIILTISIMAIIKIPILKSVYSTLLVYFLLSLSECLNMISLDLFNIDTNAEFIDPFIKCLYGIPSLIIFLLLIIIFKYLLKKKEGIKYVLNRKDFSKNRQ